MKIAVLGSTGSIGTQALQVAEKLGLEISALAANTNTQKLEEQARLFHPELIAVYDDIAAADLKVRLGDMSVCIVSGEEGLEQAAALEETDTVVTAMVGTAGLKPTLAAIEQGKRIALANKETLVCAGDIVMEEADVHGADIIPVDSEHSAIFQCIGQDTYNPIKRIWLTASGGPFRGMSYEQLGKVTAQQALRHPNWNMGSKVTIDSATMMNKGLELIEAMHLFGVEPEQVSILVHPQSIVHSMVQFEDNCVMAQMGVPDMRLSIQYALTYPVRMESQVEEVDFAALGSLTFDRPDTDAFRCLALAEKTAAVHGTACAVMNAANETAVGLFLKGKIGFNDIYESVCAALDNIDNKEEPSVEDILAADFEARKFVKLHF